MQQKGIIKPDNPEQLIERVCRTFVKQMKGQHGENSP
jgi:hypothetical protein